jgi:hypothetical protein
MPLDLGTAIGRRAHEVSRLGEFIGFFEWLVWGHLRKATVLIQMGENVVHLQDVFGGALPAFEPGAIHRVAAVRTSRDGWLSADVPGISGSFDCNHFVIASPIEGRPDPLLQTVLTKQKAEFRRTAREEALLAGWSLKATDASGDCGIDAMSYHAGETRCSPTWRCIRKELSQFMIEVQSCQHWQDAFVCCQEFGGLIPAVVSKAAKPSTTSKKSKRKAAEAMGQASQAPIFETPPRKVTLATPFSASPLVTAVSPLVHDAATCQMPLPIGPPIALEPLSLPGKAAFPDLEMTAAVLGEGDVGSAGEPPAKDGYAPASDPCAEATCPGEKRDRDGEKPASFLEWLQLQDASERLRVTHSVSTFKDEEATWDREHALSRKKPRLDTVPRRVNASSLLRYRVAVGVAYLQWRDEEGSLSFLFLQHLINLILTSTDF